MGLNVRWYWKFDIIHLHNISQGKNIQELLYIFQPLISGGITLVHCGLKLLQ